MIESASPPVRKLLALGIAAVLLAALVWLVIEPAAGRVLHVRAEIAAKRALIAQLDELAGNMPKTRDAARRAAQALAVEAYIAGESEAIRLANLQSSVSSILETAGAQPRSMRTLPTVNRDDLAMIGLHVVMTARLEGLQQMLVLVETHKPALVVDALAISSSVDPASGTPDDALLVDLRVLAFQLPGPKRGAP